MLHPVLRRCLLIVGLCLLAAPLARATEAPVAEWRFETKVDASRSTLSKLTLVVNGRQTVRVGPDEAVGEYVVVPRQKYAKLRIPEKALCACESYFAESGVRYYAVATGKDRLALYYQTDGEEGLTKFKKMFTIKVEPR